MKKLSLVTFAIATAFAAQAFLPQCFTPSASAQEVQITGPLAGAPACRECRLYREGRFQIQPFAGFTLQDEFSRTIMFGAQLQFHLSEWLGIGVWGAFAPIHIDTGLTDEITAKGETQDQNLLSFPSRQGYPDQIGTINWAAAAQLTFIPLRGKLALFQEVFIDADFYISAGVAFIGVEERADTNYAEVAGVCNLAAGSTGGQPACRDLQGSRASRVAIAPTFAVGLAFYATELLAITLEWRAMPFAWNTSGTDEAGGGPGGDFPDGIIDSEDHLFHLNHMVNVGFAFYLPTEAGVSE